MSRQYVDAVKDDIVDYIKENKQYLSADLLGTDEDDIQEELIDILQRNDVTGDISGSHFYNRKAAMDFIVQDWFETIGEAIDEGMYTAEELGVDIYNGDWEKIDVICRDFVLYESLEEVLKELGGAEKAIFGEK